MPNHTDLLNAFSAVNKAQWLEKITRDLKGKSLEELDWQLEEQLRVAATYGPEDAPEHSAPLSAGRTGNQWEIGEYIVLGDPGAANAQALEGLNGGVNAPLFQLHHLPTEEELAVLLAGIEPAFISVHFAPAYPGKDPAVLFRNLIYYTRSRGLDLSQIRGSMDFDPLLDWTEPPFAPLARIIRFAHRHTPQFKVLQVNSEHAGIEHTTRELALLVAKGVEYISQLEKEGITPAQTNQQLQFSVAINTSYFVAIAKLRALKILWANALAGFGLTDAPLPPIAAHLAAETQTGAREYNMIKAATQAMSAVIGGANQLYLPPADLRERGESSSFSRRIARNVQHLLQMESQLDQVADPAAGSYYIEQLTQQFCEQAWAKFQEIEGQGGYLRVENV
jgi:methylmalonyl-CoA mutase